MFEGKKYQRMPWKEGRTEGGGEDFAHRSRLISGKITSNHKRPLYCLPICFQGFGFSPVLTHSCKANNRGWCSKHGAKSSKPLIIPLLFSVWAKHTVAFHCRISHWNSTSYLGWNWCIVHTHLCRHQNNDPLKTIKAHWYVIAILFRPVCFFSLMMRPGRLDTELFKGGVLFFKRQLVREHLPCCDAYSSLITHKHHSYYSQAFTDHLSSPVSLWPVLQMN